MNQGKFLNYNHAPKKGGKKEKIFVLMYGISIIETEENEVNKVFKYWIIGIFKVKARLEKNAHICT